MLSGDFCVITLTVLTETVINFGVNLFTLMDLYGNTKYNGTSYFIIIFLKFFPFASDRNFLKKG